MFDKLLRDLKQLEQGMKISVDLPHDDEGYLDRHCSVEACRAEFKVLSEDWKEKIKDEQVFCPICRFEAPATEWNTEDQVEYAKRVAIAHVQKTIHTALAEDAQRFNRDQRPGFIQLSMSVGPAPHSIVVPTDAAKVMRQKFVCEVCGCRYASIGAAFFCPACGHNSAVSMFDQTIETVRRVVSLTTSIRETLATAFDEDLAQNSVRHMLEDSLGRLVSAFQQFSDILFEKLPNVASVKRRKNVFQNLAESSALWKSAIGKGYDDMLSSSELQEMESLFQKRHLIAHRNGLVDQEYIDKSGDKSYTIGQRLVINESAVLRLAELVLKLASELRRFV